ncbi:hypothetical protein THIOM_001582 [Candidatus Thiomargarita nelsonii]|uniref:Uncharacterized protein n=1 Tax=Candidatus Thiomargarita nelsonii TaxID=1003181 RepID=A0A176S3B8_9GAMM|nr:hypothetical protein THIOM_001582 [Candidatus Thiomargarita nelsonii]
MIRSSKQDYKSPLLNKIGRLLQNSYNLCQSLSKINSNFNIGRHAPWNKQGKPRKPKNGLKHYLKIETTMAF